jgi:6-phosphogluconate dehydrogenase
MQLAIIGLGKMGANMVRRLCKGGIDVIGYNRSADIVHTLADEAGMKTANSLVDIVKKCTSPRHIWLMLPSGAVTENTLTELIPLLDPGDIIIDGGNANYHDSQRRGQLLAQYKIGFVDVGTSGGIWGLEKGYCLMAGGDTEHILSLAPVLRVLAPDAQRGWAHVGPVGAGHFTKMIHNGIEYGMMQAYAEGFALLRGKTDFNLDLAQIAELWRHSSVVRSWLLDLTADFLQDDQTLDTSSPVVADSGEGRWTVEESIAQGVPAPVLAMALYMRFASQDNESYANRMLSMMRNAFGGHTIKDKPA